MIARLQEWLAGFGIEPWATAWIVAAAVLVLTVVVLSIAKRVVVNRLMKLDREDATTAWEVVAEVVDRTKSLFYVAVGLHFATAIVELGERSADAIRIAVVITIFIQVGLWASEGVTLMVRRSREKLEDDPAQTTALNAVRFVGKFIVWLAVLALVLDNLGFDITALVTSLGIGGIAVALAAQNILGDLFASLSIVVDKPFVIGDFIIVGDMMGTVEQIGLRTTRIRSLSGEQLVFSNTDLLGSRIRNFKRMDERRAMFTFGVVYQTPTDEVEAIPALVREIVEGLELTRFDRAHFKGFGDSSYDFEVVYYMLVPDFNQFMDCQQAINLALLRAFRQRGIEFAYPTRTVYLHGEDQSPAAAAAE